MRSSVRRGALLLVLIALSAAAFGKSAHVLFHAGKKIVNPVRHPKEFSRGVWRVLREVF